MNRKPIKDHENLLHAFMILLDQGVIKTSAISLWADSVLASEDESEYAFIELSTIRNGYDMLQLLRKNSENADPEIVSRALLGILYHELLKGEISPKKAADIATHISYEESLTSDEQFLLYRYYEYREINLNETDEALKLYQYHFLTLLEIYQDFHLENDEKWPEINEKLKINLEEKLEMIKQQHPY
ncbi:MULTISPECIES: hypothetical protein [Chryseobacterium]|uniref:hypothetical protein n=1 Tax=Chryseobacterium TaxID=59732 RepID=UPI001297273D|nr:MULTISPECIES: hypothetical protein [Chryseobacterium]MDR6920854.1 hypothetical protein [Chryseobacterium sp. 2987]